MTLNNLMVREITIVRPTVTTDRYGNILSDWTNTDVTQTTGWIGAFVGSEEGGTRTGAFVEGWTLTLQDVNTAIAGGDRVVVDDVEYEVDGPPLVAWTPRGPHHVEAALRKVVG